jgi:hypothetical protein
MSEKCRHHGDIRLGCGTCLNFLKAETEALRTLLRRAQWNGDGLAQWCTFCGEDYPAHKADCASEPYLGARP